MVRLRSSDLSMNCLSDRLTDVEHNRNFWQDVNFSSHPNLCAWLQIYNKDCFFSNLKTARFCDKHAGSKKKKKIRKEHHSNFLQKRTRRDQQASRVFVKSEEFIWEVVIKPQRSCHETPAKPRTPPHVCFQIITWRTPWSRQSCWGLSDSKSFQTPSEKFSVKSVHWLAYFEHLSYFNFTKGKQPSKRINLRFNIPKSIPISTPAIIRSIWMYHSTELTFPVAVSSASELPLGEVKPWFTTGNVNEINMHGRNSCRVLQINR